MTAIDFIERREHALRVTTDPITLQLLERLPRMISHHAPSGHEEICYQDGDISGPISCSQSEAKLLNLLGRQFAQKQNLEIGCGVGWSTAAFLWNNPKTTLTTVDAFIEGPGRLLLAPNQAMVDRFWENIQRLDLQERVTLFQDMTETFFRLVAGSPMLLPAQVTDADLERVKAEIREQFGTKIAMMPARIAPLNIAHPTWDFVFLDGWHLDGQPLRDMQMVLPFLSDTSVVALHDTWMPDVFHAARLLLQNGWQMHVFPTANTLTLCYKTEPAWFRKLLKDAA
jgi:predicted O-methyltransferase YrrM